VALAAPAYGFRGDIDGSGRVDSRDLIQLSLAFGSTAGSAKWNQAADLDGSGAVDGDDLSLLAAQFGRSLPDFAPEHVPGELVVLFKNATALSTQNAVLDSIGAKITYRSDSAPMVVVEVPQGQEEQALANRLLELPDIRFVEPNYIYRTNWVPNDEFYPYQWHLEMINMPQAWDVEQGGKSSVRIAVLDTGVAYEDYGDFCRGPDLKQTRFAAPKDYVNGDTHANDDQGHGSHVAGTIAQSTNNGTGVAGIAFNCTVIPVKVCGDCYAGCPLSAIADGIRWAADNGADVINMSLGGPASNVEHDAVIYAHNKDVTLVCAAGNGGGDGIDYPAAYAETIAVGAVGMNEQLAPYSDTGAMLDLVAPGGNTNQDLDRDGYRDGVYQETFVTGYVNEYGSFCPTDLCDLGVPTFYQGTSMAAPHVAGVVALMISAGTKDPEQIRQILRNTARDLGAAGFDNQYGYGLLDAERAVKAARGSGSWGWNN